MVGTQVSDHQLALKDGYIIGPPTVVGIDAYPQRTFGEDGVIAV